MKKTMTDMKNYSIYTARKNGFVDGFTNKREAEKYLKKYQSRTNAKLVLVKETTIREVLDV